MATLTVKNIPEDLYEKLKQRAKLRHRSVNKEIIVCIQEALEIRRVDPQAFLIFKRPRLGRPTALEK